MLQKARDPVTGAFISAAAPASRSSYPSGLVVLAGSYYAAFERGAPSLTLGLFMAFIAFALLRELLPAVILALAVGLVLWFSGATVAALLASVAIIIGAMIIVQLMRR